MPNQNDIIKHLEDNGHIQWQPHPSGGNWADISIDLVKAASANVSTHTKRSPEENWSSVSKRGGGGGTTGSIGGYIGKIACYNPGEQIGLDVLNQQIAGGCEALLNAALPPLAVKILRVINSQQLSDWKGKPAYLRWSTEILKSGAPGDTGLCQAAYNKFNDFCEGNGEQTAGGEVTVGDETKYNVDPVDM
ncbi:MAG: hypothetical protein Q9165_001452 [Trypethelium subeluteriae]